MKAFNTPEICRALIEIVWHFGPQGINGECCGDLSMPEFRALEKVAATQDCSVQTVGQLLGFTKSGATRIVNRLATKGYVRKLKSDYDARVCCVVITQSGNKVLIAAVDRYSKEINHLLARLPQRMRSHMHELLIDLSKTIRQ